MKYEHKQKESAKAATSHGLTSGDKVRRKAGDYTSQTASLSPMGHEGGTVASAPGGDALASYVEAPSGGAPLSGPQKDTMEGGFGRDLSHVQFHTGSQASSACDALGADAFSYQNNVFFGAGKYEPGSMSGQHLMAHEITHTLQGGSDPQAKLTVGNVTDPAEAEADRVADQVVRRIQTTSSGAPSYVQQATAAEPAHQIHRKQALETSPISVSSSGGSSMVRRMARAPQAVEDTDANYDQFVAGVATANSTIRAINHTLRMVAENTRHAQSVSGLTQAAGQLNSFGRALKNIGRAGPWVTVAVGVYNMNAAETNEEFEDAVVNMAVHLGMGLSGPLAVADAVLTVIFGPSWPSQALDVTEEVMNAAWDDIQSAVITHVGGPAFQRLERGRYYRENEALCNSGMPEFCP